MEKKHEREAARKATRKESVRTRSLRCGSRSRGPEGSGGEIDVARHRCVGRIRGQRGETDCRTDYPYLASFSLPLVAHLLRFRPLSLPTTSTLAPTPVPRTAAPTLSPLLRTSSAFLLFVVLLSDRRARALAALDDAHDLDADARTEEDVDPDLLSLGQLVARALDLGEERAAGRGDPEAVQSEAVSVGLPSDGSGEIQKNAPEVRDAACAVPVFLDEDGQDGCERRTADALRIGEHGQ